MCHNNPALLGVVYRQQCQLSPTPRHAWLQEEASIPARVNSQARWDANYAPGGGGSPSRLVNRDQWRHILAHRMDKVPTMIVRSGEQSYSYMTHAFSRSP